MKNWQHYSKTIAAVVGTVLTWAIATYGNDPDIQKYLSLATALATVLGVYSVTNKPVL